MIVGYNTTAAEGPGRFFKTPGTSCAKAGTKIATIVMKCPGEH